MGLARINKQLLFFLKVMKHSNIAETSKTTGASIPK